MWWQFFSEEEHFKIVLLRLFRGVLPCLVLVPELHDMKTAAVDVKMNVPWLHYDIAWTYFSITAYRHLSSS